MTTRGLSTAVKKAKAYLQRNPNTEGPALAKKFGINLSTVYRSDWWKNRQKKDTV